MSNKKENTDENKELIQWHTGFVHAMRLYLMDYEDDIEFNDEFQLTRKPLIIDLTVVKKPDDLVIDNNIGRFFRKHNILEYKSPRDELNLETFYKVQAYALLYMIAPGNCEANGAPINEKDITVTIVRASYPRELIKDLIEHGYTVIEQPNNIYYIEGAQFPIQIVVTKPSRDCQDDEKGIIWLNALSPNISKNLFYDFLTNIRGLDTRHGMFADTISSIVSDANEENIETWKERDAFMNNAMRRIMAKELQESRDEGINLIKKATKVAKENNISNATDLEALGFDKDTAEGAISILTELGIIS